MRAEWIKPAEWVVESLAKSLDGPISGVEVYIVYKMGAA